MEQRASWKRRGLYALAIGLMAWGTLILAWAVAMVAVIGHAISQVLVTRPMDQFGPFTTYLSMLEPIVFVIAIWLWCAARGSPRRGALQTAAVVLFGCFLVAVAINVRAGDFDKGIGDWVLNVSLAAAPAGAWLFSELWRRDRRCAVAGNGSDAPQVRR